MKSDLGGARYSPPQKIPLFLVILKMLTIILTFHIE